MVFKQSKDKIFTKKQGKSGVCKGFTLAEVLITLGILGVVAALTIPSLINRHQEIETVSKLKKSYSVLSQAFLMAVQDQGTPDN